MSLIFSLNPWALSDLYAIGNERVVKSDLTQAIGKELLESAFKGDLKKVQQILEDSGHLVGSFKGIALGLAAEEGHTEVARCLLMSKQGVGIRSQKIQLARTLAKENGHKPITTLIKKVLKDITNLDSKTLRFN